MGSSSGGGDGGAAQAAQIKAEQDKSINELNKLFGTVDPTAIVNKLPYESQQYQNFRSTLDTNKSSGSALTRSVSNAFGQDSAIPDTVKNSFGGTFDQAGYDGAIKNVTDENALTKSMREAFYQNTGNDVFNLKKESLDKSKLNADRELKFQLARTGNFGGSNQIDQGNNVADNYDRGLLDIGNLKQSTINNARANDETSRVDLIGRIRAGMNQADALNSAASQQQSNLAQARDNALSQTITDYFGGMKYLQGQNQYQQDFATAQKKYGTQAKAFNGTVGTI